MKIGTFPYILYRFDKATSDNSFQIQSSGKRLITNQQYLSTTKGEGGHIIGFLEYFKGNEAIADSLLNYATLKSAMSAFMDEKHPDLIILDPNQLFELLWEKKLVEAQLEPSNEDALSQVIQPKQGVIKFARLGRLMTPQNNAEINFIGDYTLKATVIRNVNGMDSRMRYATIKKVLDSFYDKTYTNTKQLIGFSPKFLNQDVAKITGGLRKSLRRKRQRRLRTRKTSSK